MKNKYNVWMEISKRLNNIKLDCKSYFLFVLLSKGKPEFGKIKSKKYSWEFFTFNFGRTVNDKLIQQTLNHFSNHMVKNSKNRLCVFHHAISYDIYENNSIILLYKGFRCFEKSMRNVWRYKGLQQWKEHHTKKASKLKPWFESKR